MADTTTADLLVERLLDWGVDTVFGLPGDGINGVFEALRTRKDKIRFVQVRHEESAAFAASGYAKWTGKLGVCVVTSGPGGIHLLNGLYDAKTDGQPVLAITGHTYHDLIGTHYQQDVDLDKVFADVAVYNQRVMGPNHVVNVVDAAIRTALARRGVAHLTLPKDVQSWTLSDSERSAANIPKHSGDVFAKAYPLPSQQQLAEAAALINQGSKVAILAGRGALGSRDELIQLAEKTAGPIIKALLGKAAVPDKIPYTTGGIGLLGTSASYETMQECDTLIIVGSGMPYIEFYPKPGQAKVVQIDTDPAHIGARQPVDVGLVGDARETLRALLPLLERKDDRSFLETAQQRMKSWNELLEERGTRSDTPMKPQVVTYELNKLLDNNAIVVTDSGTNTAFTARYIDMRGDMQFSCSGSLASMANGLPYSIAAAVAYPGRQVVCVIGDGGLSMLMGELATLAKYKLPVKVVVIKNNTLGQIKWEQIAFEGNPEYGVELEPIDFALVAQGCGVAGYTIDNAKDAAATLREALAADGPAVVQAVVDGNEPLMPGHITVDQALKFATALVRGQKDRTGIIKALVENTVREVI